MRPVAHNVTFALVPARDDDEQAVFSAQPIIGPAYLMVATLVEMVVLVADEADCIENQMVVNISLVNMGGKYRLVLTTQYFFCRLRPNLMGFLRKHPLQRFSFPYSAPLLSRFRAGRKGHFQG